MPPLPATARTREVLVDTAARLPAAPQILAEVNELLLDPHLQLDDVVVVLRRDATLASAVVRIANSPIYGGARIGSIEDAVARVGLAEVFRVVGLATTSRLKTLALPAYGLTAGQVAQNALLHALALESLAPFAGLDSLVAYTGGLLRGLGMMVLDQIVRHNGAPDTPLFAGPGFLQAEREWTDWTSPEVTATVLEAWHFAPELVEAVREQHLLGDAARCSRLALAMNLAGRIVEDLEYGFAPESGFWRRDQAALELLAISEDQLAAAYERTARQYERQRFALE